MSYNNNVTNRQRRELLRNAYNTIEALESRPVRNRPINKFPFNLLEIFFDWLLLLLERLISAAVKAVLDRLEKPKERFKEWLRRLWRQLWA